MAPVWPHLGLQKPYLVFPPTHQLPCALYCSMCSVLLSDTLLYYPHFNRKINWGSEMLSNLHKITQVIRIWFQTWGVTELFCVLSRAQKEASCSSPRPTPLPPRLFPIFLFSPFLSSSLCTHVPLYPVYSQYRYLKIVVKSAVSFYINMTHNVIHAKLHGILWLISFSSLVFFSLFSWFLSLR